MAAVERPQVPASRQGAHFRLPAMHLPFAELFPCQVPQFRGERRQREIDQLGISSGTKFPSRVAAEQPTGHPGVNGRITARLVIQAAAVKLVEHAE